MTTTGGTDSLIRCPRCGNCLGELIAGCIVMKHRGRKFIGVPVSIQCELCPGVWMPPAYTEIAEAEMRVRARIPELKPS